MTAMTTQAARWRDRLVALLPADLRRRDAVRAQLRRQVNAVLMVHDDRLHDLANGAWRSAGQQSSAEQIAAAARELLPPGPVARSVLLLHDIEGYKHEEIAELTGIAVGTSKAQLHRARKLMKEWLE